MRTPALEELFAIVGATADQLAKPIECELRDIAFSENVDARAELHFEAVIFALHVLDRWSLSRLGFAGRELTMGGVQSAVVTRLEPEHSEAMRDAFNEYQRVFANIDRLLPGNGESLKGTFCWEYSKYLLNKLAPEELGKLAMFSVAASNAAVFLFRVCDSICRD